MSDVRIFRIGPLDEDGTSLYVPVSDERALEVVDARDHEAGIRSIVEQWPEGSYLCSPDLSTAAGRLGIPVAPLEAITEGTRLKIALGVAQEPDFDGIDHPRAFLALMRGATEFVLRKAAARWPSRLSVDVELRGERNERWFGAILHEPQVGVALFRDAADAKACALCDGAEQEAFLAQRDHLQVRFEVPPPYVAEWLEDFYRVDRMPRLTKRQGTSVIADDDDALLMGGVLSALALVDDVRETMYSTIKTPTGEFRAFVSPGSPWPFVQLLGM
jgi:hypothetical protein